MIAGARVPMAAEPAVRLPPAALPDVGLQRQPTPPEPPAPGLSLPEAPAPTAPRTGGGVRFTLRQVLVDGATVFSEAVLRPTWQDFLDRAVSLADMQQVARSIEEIYRADGYFLVRALVPVQTISEGRVRILVLEGGVAEVMIDGDIGPVADLVRDYLRPVTSERPLRLATLERALLLANEIPGVSVSGTLRPAARQQGSADLIVSAKRRPLGAALVVDNFGDDYTGRQEGALSLLSNAWTSLGEQITLTGFATEPWSQHSQRVGQATTSWRPGLGGLVFDTIVSYGNSRPGGDIADLDFDSTTLLIGGAVAYPVLRRRAYAADVRLSFEQVSTRTEDFNDDVFSDDKLSILSLGASGSFRDGLDGLTSLSASLRQGLPVFDATRRRDEDKSREDGTGQSTIVRGAVSRLQPLIHSFSLFLNGGAQYAFSPLLSYEQFTLGGTVFGRGYAFSQVTGDSGVGGTAELRYDFTPEWRWLDRIQFFAFADGGRVWSRQDTGDDQLSSAGGGVRLFPVGRTTLELQAAQPLTLKSDRTGDGREPQFLFRATARL